MANEWLEKHGFNEQEKCTYIYYPEDAYDIRQELKDAGFRFSRELMWHIAAPPAEYRDKCIRIPLDKVVEMYAWGEGAYVPDVKKIISDALDNARPEVIYNSEWIGEEGSRLKNISVTLVYKYTKETMYGLSTLYKFRDKNENSYTWWTTTYQPYEIGDKVIMSATVKKHDIYRNEHITVVTRARLKEA